MRFDKNWNVWKQYLRILWQPLETSTTLYLMTLSSNYCEYIELILVEHRPQTDHFDEDSVYLVLSVDQSTTNVLFRWRRQSEEKNSNNFKQIFVHFHSHNWYVSEGSFQPESLWREDIRNLVSYSTWKRGLNWRRIKAFLLRFYHGSLLMYKMGNFVLIKH